LYILLTAQWRSETIGDGLELIARVISSLMRYGRCFTFGAACEDCSLSAEYFISPLTCVAFILAKVALITLASATDPLKHKKSSQNRYQRDAVFKISLTMSTNMKKSYSSE
jgi:hypothetical protein